MLHRLLAHLEAAATPDALAKTVRTQGCLNRLVSYVLDRRFGSSERLGVDAPVMARRQSIDVHNPAIGMSISGLLSQVFACVCARAGAGACRGITLCCAWHLGCCRRLKELPLCTPVMYALLFCAVNTTKPVVRQNTFTHLFDWIKAQLDASGNNESLFTTTRGRSASPTVYQSCADASGSPMVELPSDSAPITLVGPVDFDVMKAVMMYGISDVWSAIRKACATRLFSFVDLLPLRLVHRVYCDLVAVATSPETDHKYVPSPVCVRRALLTRCASTCAVCVPVSVCLVFTRGGGSSSWRRKEGALLGMAMVVKRFRRTGAAEHSGAGDASPSKGSAGHSHSTRNRAKPSLATIPASPRDGAAHASGSGQATATDLASRRRPTGRSRGMRRVQSEYGGLRSGPKPLASPATLAFVMRRNSTASGRTSSPRVVICNDPGAGPNAIPAGVRSFGRSPVATASSAGAEGDARSAQGSPNPNIPRSGGASGGAVPSPRGGSTTAWRSHVTESHPTLLFGHNTRMTLPLFITASMRRVVYPMLEHEQLSVRENAIRLFAAFLVRVGMSETTLALKEVLNMLRGEGVEGWKRRLRHHANASLAADAPMTGVDVLAQSLDLDDDEHADFIPDVDEDNMLVPDPYTAEGVLGMGVIVVRLAPLDIFLRSWSVIFPTVFMYLSHPASTVRQMASKVFLQISAKGRDKGTIPLVRGAGVCACMCSGAPIP